MTVYAKCCESVKNALLVFEQWITKNVRRFVTVLGTTLKTKQRKTIMFYYNMNLHVVCEPNISPFMFYLLFSLCLFRDKCSYRVNNTIAAQLIISVLMSNVNGIHFVKPFFKFFKFPYWTIEVDYQNIKK